jgi:hypothetical protein
VSSKTPDPKLAEAGRKGGLASGEARRKRRDRGWHDAFVELVDAKPDEFAAGLFGAGNAMARVRALELAQTAKDARLRQRQKELDRQDRELRERAREVARREHRMDEEWPTWLEMTERESARIEAEVADLERMRDELRAAIEAEAEAADMELVDVADDA